MTDTLTPETLNALEKAHEAATERQKHAELCWNLTDRADDEGSLEYEAAEVIRGLAGSVDALRAKNEMLKRELRQHRTAWENVIDLGLLADRYAVTARELADGATAALKGETQ